PRPVPVGGRRRDPTGQRDPASGQRVRIAARGHDRQAGAWVGGQVAASLGLVRYAQQRRAIQQSVRDQRRPWVAVGGQRGKRGRIVSGSDGAGLLGRRRLGRVFRGLQRRRRRRRIADIAMITIHHNREATAIIGALLE